MAERKKKKNPYLMPAIIAITLIAVLIVSIVLTRKKSDKMPVSDEKISEQDSKYQEKRDKEIKQELSKKSEQQRMEYYCGNFFSLVNNKNYEKAYDLLYDVYKENYFPNFANFERYLKEYFPSNFTLSFSNMERLGDIYVLMVTVKDTINGNYGKNFDMYVVIQENSLNDYVISFSRNSAVGEGE